MNEQEMELTRALADQLRQAGEGANQHFSVATGMFDAAVILLGQDRADEIWDNALEILAHDQDAIEHPTEDQP